MPNLTDKFIEGGATAGTEKEAGLPNITGTGTSAITFWNTSGAFKYNDSAGMYFVLGGSNGNSVKNVIFNASLSNSIYGNSDTVQPLALTMKYLIKYN